MADTTPQKRVLPARERRESAVKRRLSTPVGQPAMSPKATPAQTEPAQAEPPRQKRKYTKRASLIKAANANADDSSPAPTEDNLPLKLALSKPLPVSQEKQSENLSNREYQSIADSAILAAALHRSRMQWLCEGLFKRYWTKPYKRKGVIEQPVGNPEIKSMQKLGNATITIEPHSFDVTFYTVRDPNGALAPYQRHPNQHTTKQPHSLPSKTDVYPPRPPPPGAVPHATTATKQPKVEDQGHCSIPAHATQPPVSTHPPAAARAPPPGPAGPSKPSDDPVIQMLAARAASDQRLKDLMKIVAMSLASPEQLREFQAHIDEFNAIIKMRDAKKPDPNPPPQVPNITRPPLPTSAASTPPSASVHRQPAAAIGGTAPATPTQPYMAYYPPPPRPEPIIKHIIVEFTSPISNTQGPNTDRFMFPEHAVLEMRPNGFEMVASFFAERSGKEVLRSYGVGDDGDEMARAEYQADHEYFQPVTMLIKATQHRTIETIARAAKPLVEVQKYMKMVMETKHRAPVEYLVHRLPRDKGRSEPMPRGHDFVDSGVDISDEEEATLQDYYGV